MRDVADSLVEVLLAFERAILTATFLWRGFCVACGLPIFGLRYGAMAHPGCYCADAYDSTEGN